MSASTLPLSDGFEPQPHDGWLQAASASLRGTSLEDIQTKTDEGLPVDVLYTERPIEPAPLLIGGRGGWEIRQRLVVDESIDIMAAANVEMTHGVESLELVCQPDGHAKLLPLLQQLAPQSNILGIAGESELLCSAEMQEVLKSRQHPFDVHCEPIGAYVRNAVGRSEIDSHIQTVVNEYGDSPAHGLLRVDGERFHFAGAGEIQELTYTMAMAIDYLRRLETIGWPPSRVAGRISLRLAADSELFLTIAKLRAAHLVWNTIGKACGVTDRPVFEAITARRMFSMREPINNVLRATAAAMGATIGGAQRITVLPHETASGTVTNAGRRLARNIQHILREESRLGVVGDAARGSFYVESMTNQFAERAWQGIQGIEDKGGFVQAIADGRIVESIAESADARSAAIAHRQKCIIGVNVYPDSTDETSRSHPLDIEAVAPLSGQPLDSDFQVLVRRSDALARCGQRPKVLLVRIGDGAKPFADLAAARSFYGTAGLEMVEVAIDDALHSIELPNGHCRLACLCGHLDNIEGPISSLRSAGIVLIDAIANPGTCASVDRFVHDKCDALSLLSSTLDLYSGEKM